MIEIAVKHGDIVRQAVGHAQSQHTQLKGTLSMSLDMSVAPLPAVFTELDLAFRAIHEILQRTLTNDHLRFPDDLAALLRLSLLQYRRHFVSRTEVQRTYTSSPEVISGLEAAAAEIELLLESDWCMGAPRLRRPRASDFISLGRLREHFIEAGSPEREPPYEDKFRILFAPSSIASDLSRYRATCDLRDTSVAVVFVDLDNFKRFNEALGETRVDAVIFPPVMRLVERVVFGHGRAYRHGGGDEIILLLPNCSTDIALSLLKRLRAGMAAIPSPLQTSITASAGLCIVPPDSYLTDQEVLDRANAAKNAAKRNGRDRVALFEDLSDPSSITDMLSARDGAA